MSKAKLWFLSPSGRRFSFGVAYVTGLGAFVAHWLPHSFGLEKYREIVQMYKNGLDMPLDSEVKKRAEQVLEECKLPERLLKPGVRFFCVYGVDMFYAGSSYLNNGILVGIPKHFAYKSTADVEKSEIQVFNKNVDWNSKAGRLLIDSLVLSERAQKFAIAQQIHRANTLHPISNGVFGSLGVITAYVLSRDLNSRFNLYERARNVRLTMYSLCATIGTLIFYILKDSTALYWDRKADDLSINMGPEYLKGGIEYYEKLLKRNRALRELMGENGKRVYTVQGNESVFIRTKKLPLTERLDYLRDQAALITENNEPMIETEIQ